MYRHLTARRINRSTSRYPTRRLRPHPESFRAIKPRRLRQLLHLGECFRPSSNTPLTTVRLRSTILPGRASGSLRMAPTLETFRIRRDRVFQQHRTLYLVFSTLIAGLDLWHFRLRLDNVITEVPLAIGYLGLAPGTVGVYQLNFRMPDQLPKGPAWIHLQRIASCGARPNPGCGVGIRTDATEWVPLYK